MKTFGKKPAINCNPDVKRRIEQAVLTPEERHANAVWNGGVRPRAPKATLQVSDSRNTDVLLTNGFSLLLTVIVLGTIAFVAVSSGVPYFNQIITALGVQ